ncbi:acyl-CoA synthetase [Roseitranquillus sediminis]|uniref:acyl-CoA synthetase n=1 Tax=Roseitranquillus sediminis TaxID=2809051 RepID=UPI001D0CA519|nr:acyl-CoA synthetase [Roseitranquillus sediminis]MBM9594658.1 acyl-CoA synthetase [Roseitranquillus sediminis]
MASFASKADAEAIQNEMPWNARGVPQTIYRMLSETAGPHGARSAVSYQIQSGPRDKAITLTWSELHAQVTQAANLFRSLGVGERDVVAFVLPNSVETAVTLLGGAVAGIVNPINPLLESGQIAGILRETQAKVVVTLRGFPKTDIAAKVAAALEEAPGVETVLEVDLRHYLAPPKSWLVPLIRPRTRVRHKARVLDFAAEVARQNRTLDFADSAGDRVAAYFHTGGTTGLPKIAQHRYSGMVYNGWIGATLLFREDDNLICPLPLFHVFAAIVVVMSSLASGAHVVYPTPAGYRGEGVFDNFWKLIERWKISFVITVPTAISALMQRPVDADVSSLKLAFSGSSPLPVELYNRFEKATDVNIVEGYGLTEATCLVSCNPPGGSKKIGSVGIPFPYTDVRILLHRHGEVQECATDEVGEICIASPGVNPGSTYTERDKNNDLFHHDVYLRTGDLGRIDSDGYIWITGRAKDLIIRGGHNVDPALIEEALAGHDAVAFVGAIGQPDAHSGELPCAYVELCEGAEATVEELRAFARERITERAAMPKYIEILDELPKTAVGKIFKPDLRKRAIARIYDQALAAAGLETRVAEVIDDRRRGLVARLHRAGPEEDVRVAQVLGDYTRPWEWAD